MVAVNVDSVDPFKSRLNKFWMHQDVKYDYKTEVVRPGNDEYAVIISRSDYLCFIVVEFP